MTEPALIEAASAGDDAAFRDLAEHTGGSSTCTATECSAPFTTQRTRSRRRCCGRGGNLDGFEGRSSFRAWLYRIATNVCLDLTRSRARRVPELRSFAEIPWLQPYPDRLLDEVAPSEDECRVAIRAAKEAGAPCVIGSMAYDVTLDGSTFRTMMGIDPEQAAQVMEELGADVVALNCGTGMDMNRAREAVERYRAVTSLPVMAQPNAGLPKLVQMKVVYDELPEDMVQGVSPLLAAGANIIGACCGSTPAHVRAMRQALREQPALDPSEIELVGAIAARQYAEVPRRSSREDRRSRRG